MLDIENIENKFEKIVNSFEWNEFQKKFNNCNDIYVIGHGGNLAIADHTAIDITRLSNGRKNAQAPSSACVATSLINDTNFDQWMVSWLKHRTNNKDLISLKQTLVYGISSSGKSTDVIKALQWASDIGMQVVLVTGQQIPVEIPGLTTILLETKYYHTCEVLTLLLQYQLTQGSGRKCPAIRENSSEELQKLNWKGVEVREHSYPDEKINIGIDFDGVIHKCSKGFFNGTIYDDPVEGSKEALEKISKNNVIIIYTCKAKPDRCLVNGKTGTELVWDWLKKHNMSQYVSKVTAEKPRAKYYIDDKAIRFLDWESVLTHLDSEKVL